MSNKIYNVVIVGAGSIGALKPDKYDCPGGENILTMAHAVVNHPKMNLYGIIDSKEQIANSAADKWGTKEKFPHIYTTIQELLAWCIKWNVSIDIMIVCTPTETHHEITEQCMACKPKLIIAEKPFCSDAEEAEHVIGQAKTEGIPIAIDYIRRYPKAYQELKSDFNDGKYGKIFHTKVTYTRGLKHEACHAIDLMRCFFGEFEYGNAYIDDNSICDGDENDLTFSAIMGFEKCMDVLFCPVDGRTYSIFEIEIFTEKARICLEAHGELIKIYKPIPEPVYGDYLTMPVYPEKDIETNLSRGLMELMQNSVDHLEENTPLLCTAHDALAVQKIYQKLGV